MSYKNFRTEAIIPNWRVGTDKTTARFTVEHHNKFGQRVVRTVKHPFRDEWLKPSVTRWCTQAALADEESGSLVVVLMHEECLVVVLNARDFMKQLFCFYPSDEGTGFLMCQLQDLADQAPRSETRTIAIETPLDVTLRAAIHRHLRRIADMPGGTTGALAKQTITIFSPKNSQAVDTETVHVLADLLQSASGREFQYSVR